jgi:hypothetical protein
MGVSGVGGPGGVHHHPASGEDAGASTPTDGEAATIARGSAPHDPFAGLAPGGTEAERDPANAVVEALTNDARGVVSREDAARIVDAALRSILDAADPQAAFEDARKAVRVARRHLGTDPTARRTLELFAGRGAAAVAARVAVGSGSGGHVDPLARFRALDSADRVDVLFGVGDVTGFPYDAVERAEAPLPPPADGYAAGLTSGEYSHYDPLDAVWDGGSATVPAQDRFTYAAERTEAVRLGGEVIGYVAELVPSDGGASARVAFDATGGLLEDEVVAYEVGRSGGAAPATAVAGFSNAQLEALSADVATHLSGNVLGHDEWTSSVKLDGAGGWEAAITDHLLASYMDDMDVSAAPSNDAAVAHAAHNLDYIGSGTAGARDRVAAIEAALRDSLTDPDLALFTLDSRGYGSFGEGNGFAVVDTTTGESLVVVSGYAE